ncbi:MAG: hypothetical protein H6828_16150 [Planctomycetes bacterium]|nr:hypothetical protein [Planctomycetota bacterium]
MHRVDRGRSAAARGAAALDARELGERPGARRAQARGRPPAQAVGVDDELPVPAAREAQRAGARHPRRAERDHHAGDAQQERERQHGEQRARHQEAEAAADAARRQRARADAVLEARDHR